MSIPYFLHFILHFIVDLFYKYGIMQMSGLIESPFFHRLIGIM